AVAAPTPNLKVRGPVNPAAGGRGIFPVAWSIEKLRFAGAVGKSSVLPGAEFLTASTKGSPSGSLARARNADGWPRVVVRLWLNDPRNGRLLILSSTPFTTNCSVVAPVPSLAVTMMVDDPVNAAPLGASLITAFLSSVNTVAPVIVSGLSGVVPGSGLVGGLGGATGVPFIFVNTSSRGVGGRRVVWWRWRNGPRAARGGLMWVRKNGASLPSSPALAIPTSPSRGRVKSLLTSPTMPPPPDPPMPSPLGE